MRKPSLIISLIIFTAALIGGFFWYQKSHPASTNLSSREKLLANIDRHLTVDQQKIYTDRIQKAEEYLKTLKPGKSNYKQELSNAYVYLGQQYQGLGQMQKAKEAYSLALKADPANGNALVGLSLTLLESSDPQGAAALLKQVLDRNSNNPDVWIRYIDVQKSMGTANGELDNFYTQALKSTGRYIDVLTSYANFQEKIGNTEEAIALWEEAAKSYPQNAGAYRQEAARVKKLQN